MVDWVGEMYGTPVERHEIRRPGNQPYGPLRPDPVGVYHTTEGFHVDSALGTLASKFAPPHFVCGEHRIVQTRPLWAQGASLRSGTGGWNAYCIQIETVDRSRFEPWTPGLGTLEPTAKVLAWCSENLGIPLVYAGTGQRGETYPNEPGWYGHLDVQENTHGDPGTLRWSDVFAAAEEYAMALDPKYKELLDRLLESPLDPRYQELLDRLLEMPTKEGEGTAPPRFVAKRIVDAVLKVEESED